MVQHPGKDGSPMPGKSHAMLAFIGQIYQCMVGLIRNPGFILGYPDHQVCLQLSQKQRQFPQAAVGRRGRPKVAIRAQPLQQRLVQRAERVHGHCTN